MILPVRTPSTRSTRVFRAAVALAGTVIAAAAARGQTVSTYLPPEVLTPSTEPRSAFAQLGMFDLNPHMAVSTVYDDNIYLRENTHEDDFIWVLSPGFDVVKSPTEQDAIFSTRLTYNPAFVFFTSHGTNDSIDHFLRWNGDMRLSKLSVSLSQDFESSAGGVVDVGNRVDQDYYLTTARVGYDITEKTTAQIGGTYRIRDYERLISSQEWIEDNAVHYQISSKVRLGAGVSVGQLVVEDSRYSPGNTQTFVTPSVRAAYRTTEKTDVSLSLGGEWRSYDDGSTRFGPVFTLAGNYRPWDHTTFTIEGHRREQNSAVLAGQDFVTTGFSLGASRRFMTRYRVRGSFTYDNADYRSAGRGVSAQREDDYLLLRSGVDAMIGMNWTVGVFHQYRINESSENYDFDNQQAGAQAVWTF